MKKIMMASMAVLLASVMTVLWGQYKVCPKDSIPDKDILYVDDSCNTKGFGICIIIPKAEAVQSIKYNDKQYDISQCKYTNGNIYANIPYAEQGQGGYTNLIFQIKVAGTIKNYETSNKQCDPNNSSDACCNLPSGANKCTGQYKWVRDPSGGTGRLKCLIPVSDKIGTYMCKTT